MHSGPRFVGGVWYRMANDHGMPWSHRSDSGSRRPHFKLFPREMDEADVLLDNEVNFALLSDPDLRNSTGEVASWGRQKRPSPPLTGSYTKRGMDGRLTTPKEASP